MKQPEERGPMSDEEWMEMRAAFEREVRRLHQLYERSPALFWREPNVGKCSERQRRYLEKNAEMVAKDPWGVL